MLTATISSRPRFRAADCGLPPELCVYQLFRVDHIQRGLLDRGGSISEESSVGEISVVVQSPVRHFLYDISGRHRLGRGDRCVTDGAVGRGTDNLLQRFG